MLRRRLITIIQAFCEAENLKPKAQHVHHEQKSIFKNKIEQSKQIFESWKIDAMQINTKDFLTGGRRGKSINFDLNFRCILACYWLGIGSKDMVKLISMLRFGSMPAFERYSTRNEKMLNRGIICVGKHIIQNSMVNEIIHSIKIKLMNYTI